MDFPGVGIVTADEEGDGDAGVPFRELPVLPKKDKPLLPEEGVEEDAEMEEVAP